MKQSAGVEVLLPLLSDSASANDFNKKLATYGSKGPASLLQNTPLDTSLRKRLRKAMHALKVGQKGLS